MPEIPDLLTMLKSGVHFGHQLARRHPKMEPYIFTAKSGFHIIDLELTQQKLVEALDFTRKIVANGGTILFLGTKRQAQPIVVKYAKECGMPYITERWLGGTFTNFGEIRKLIRKFTNLKKKKETGELEKYTKKERLDFEREIEKLDKMVGGIESLSKIPDAVFICGLKKEKTAVAEANKKNIPIVAMCDTNDNPNLVTYPVTANDDAIKSIELFVNLICQAIKEGLADKEKEKDKEAVKVADNK